MSERKNIDKLFQEKFKDFESAAPEDSWPIIEARLKEKKKRRIIPFWWKLSGIAAALLIGFFIADGFFNSGGETKSGVVVNGNPKTDNLKSNENRNATPNAIVNNESRAATSQEGETNSNADGMVSNPKIQSGGGNPTTANSEKAIATNQKNANAEENKNQSNSNIKKPYDNNPNRIKTVTTSNSALVINENENSDAIPQSGKNQREKIISNRNKKHVSSSIASNVNGKKTANKSSHLKATKVLNANSDAIVNNQNKTESNKTSYTQETNSAIANHDNNIKKEVPETISKIDGKPNPIVSSEEKPKTKKLDSTAIATVVPNALEELLNEKENNLVTKEPHVNRWQITSSVAPIYFGSTSNGSPIDSSFAGNSKGYKTNISVGLGVNYAINKKFKIRTGISQVTFNYNTNDVLMYSDLQSNGLGNVDPSPGSQFLHFGRRAAAPASAAAAQTELTTDKFDSYINQQMGYIEVPLEVSYSVIDKRFGLNIIGGLSTLFLNENKIVVVSSGMTSDLGEANNLNKTHFSSNVGLGIRYRLYKAFQANFEPMFKYQLNTFSKDSGNFKPYFFGLYTGLSYSF
jgi:hypothetical protein